MPFNGGGGGALPPHEHTNIANDGGPLDFNNTTIGSMNAGDITFSDGAALQTLAYPGVPAGETLTAAALSTSPSWVSAAGGTTYEEVDSIELTIDAATIGLTFPAISADDIASLEVFYGGRLQNAGTDCSIRINNQSGPDYNTQYNQVTAGVGSIFENAAATEIRTSPNCQQIYGHISIQAGTTAQATTYDTFIQYMGTQSGKDLNAVTNYAGYINNGGMPTTATNLTQFEIFPAGGNFRAGFWLTVYKINRT
jgi:hypothetical protein